MSNIKLACGDCLELMRGMPDKSVDLVLTDPPYNIGVTTQRNGKSIVNQWDKISNYIDWCMEWLSECSRVLKPNGVLYFWHNDISQFSRLVVEIEKRTSLKLISFCIWDKGDGYRAQSWHNRDPKGKTALRSWFNVCEYCLHFFNTPSNNSREWEKTALDRINSNPECFKTIKDWYRSELTRLNITENDLILKYREATGKSGAMFRHYFKDSQFELPTRQVYDEAFVPLGFARPYESLRNEYESLRNVHHCDNMHCNVWHVPPVPSTNRMHTCQKPLEILERIIKVSSNDGAAVLDPFMGSGSTGVACVNTGRDFIGFEIDRGYFDIAEKRIKQAQEEVNENQTEREGAEWH